MKADAIIFDVDGTLIDVSNSYREAAIITVRLFCGRTATRDDIKALKLRDGFNNDWDVTYALAKGISDFAGVDRSDPDYAELKDIFQEHYLGSALYERIYARKGRFTVLGLINNERLLVREETLDALRRYPKAVVTSRPRFEALYALAPLMPKYFSEGFVVALEDCEREKPDPAPLLKAKALLRCSAPVYVGDSYGDVLAAQRAGMRCIYVGEKRLGDATIGSINELAGVLNEA
jgi:HAD superfamily hydrolase (TIGR01548 family)